MFVWLLVIEQSRLALLCFPYSSPQLGSYRLYITPYKTYCQGFRDKKIIILIDFSGYSVYYGAIWVVERKMHNH